MRYTMASNPQIDPANPLVYWYGGNDTLNGWPVMSVSRSTDSGATWTRFTFDSTNYGRTTCIRIDPVNSSIVYAGGTHGIFKTENNGKNWTRCPNIGYAAEIIINPMAGNVIYASDGNYTLFKSTNSGNTWDTICCFSYPTNRFCLYPGKEEIIFAGTGKGVQVSYNSGRTWAKMEGPIQDKYITVLRMDQQKKLYAGTFGAGIFTSATPTNLIGKNTSQQRRGAFFINAGASKNLYTISFELAENTRVAIKVFDTKGRLIRTILNQNQKAGTHELSVDLNDSKTGIINSGIFIVTLEYGNCLYSRRICVIR